MFPHAANNSVLLFLSRSARFCAYVLYRFVHCILLGKNALGSSFLVSFQGLICSFLGLCLFSV